MIIFGSILLITGIALVWFRTPLTGTRLGSGDFPASVYMVNQSGETTVLYIAGLLGILGIGLILVGAARSNSNRNNSSGDT